MKQSLPIEHDVIKHQFELVACELRRACDDPSIHMPNR